MAAAGASALGGGNGRECVKVVVRCRPLFGKELVEGRQSIVAADETASTISVSRPEGGGMPKTFTFDAVYGTESRQATLYEETAYPLVEAVMQGFNGTIFAYGQTGCGKTFTMQGVEEQPELRGVIPNSFDHVFENIRLAEGGQEFLVRASYLEIYNEEIRDLLANDPKRKLELKENADRGVFVKGLTDVVVEDVNAINSVMQRGFRHRTVGATLMNNESSRSHSIFSIVVEVSEKGEDGGDHFRVGKLNLVDLAGSERQSKTQASGERLKEGCKINLSLSALGNVISALVDGRGKHIPYRDSKLTRLLQDSLGGNTKTVMVACISPADYNFDETVSTLRYANRAKNIKNKPVINEDPKDAMLRQYKDEIERLQQMLTMQAAAGANPGMTVPAGLAPISLDAAAGAVPDDSPQIQTQIQTQVQVVEKVVERVVEVPSDASAAERKAMEEYNASIEAQRNRLGDELESERAARDQLQAKLAELQTKIMGATGGGGGEAAAEGAEDVELALARQQREARRAQQKLKARKKKEALREAQHQRQLAEQKEREEELKTAMEDAEAFRASQHERITRLTEQYEEARMEIGDLTTEFEREREHLLNMLREQNREIKLLSQVAEVILPAKEMGKVWERAQWDEDREEWTLPKIKPRAGFKLTDVKLPSLGGGPPGEGTPTVESDEEGGGGGPGSSDRPPRRPPTSGSSRRRKHRDRDRDRGDDDDGSSSSRRERRERKRESRSRGGSRSRGSRSRGNDAPPDGAEAGDGDLGTLDGAGWPPSMGAGVSDAPADSAFGDRVGSRQGARRAQSRNGMRPGSSQGSSAADLMPIGAADGAPVGERAPSRNGSRAKQQQRMSMKVSGSGGEGDRPGPTVSLQVDGGPRSGDKGDADGLNFSFNATLTFEQAGGAPPSGPLQTEPPAESRRSGSRRKKHRRHKDKSGSTEAAAASAEQAASEQ